MNACTSTSRILLATISVLLSSTAARAQTMTTRVSVDAHGVESVRPHLLEQGAVECLLKPFSDTALREALNTALRTS